MPVDRVPVCWPTPARSRTHYAARRATLTKEPRMLIRYLVALAPFVLAAVPLAAQDADWRSYNGTLEGTRYSSLEQISASNAATLSRVCSFDTGEQMSMQSIRAWLAAAGPAALLSATIFHEPSACFCQREK